MNPIVMCAMGLIFVGGPLLAIVHYKTVRQRGVLVKIKQDPKTYPSILSSELIKRQERDSLTKNQKKPLKIFRPSKRYYYSREIPLGFVLLFLIFALIQQVYPIPLSDLIFHAVIQFALWKLFDYFKPSHFFDRLSIIISDESITGRGGSTLRCLLLMHKQITFPIKNIDSQASKNLKLSRMQTWFGYRYIYSTEGKKIILSRLVFTKEQISEILNEVDTLTKTIAEDQANERGQDKVG